MRNARKLHRHRIASAGDIYPRDSPAVVRFKRMNACSVFRLTGTMHLCTLSAAFSLTFLSVTVASAQPFDTLTADRGEAIALFDKHALDRIHMSDPTLAVANQAQEYICAAGLGMGQAAMRVWFFGRAFGGIPPADQRDAIGANLSNAAASIQAAEDLVITLHRSALRDGAVSQIKQDLDQFSERTRGRSPRQASNYIRGISSRYYRQLAVDFVSARPDALQARSTCDSQLLEACYSYGAATIASAIAEPDRSRLQAGAAQSNYVTHMHQTIRGGLALAMDGTPPDLHTDKVCCAFGTPAAWNPILAIRSNSPSGTFAGNEGTLLQIAREATLRPGVCGERPPERLIRCNEVAEEGADEPETIRVDVNGSREVTFAYRMFNIKDRMILKYNGISIFDTACVGGSDSVTLSLSGFDDEVVVDVYPNCAGERNTAWEFRLLCPDLAPPSSSCICQHQSDGEWRGKYYVLKNETEEKVYFLVLSQSSSSSITRSHPEYDGDRKRLGVFDNFEEAAAYAHTFCTAHQ